MMRVFLDSSALAKRYVLEAGTDKVVEICANAKEVVLSILCIPEVISALNRLKRESKLSIGIYEKLKGNLGEDVNQATIIPIDHSVLRKAILCLEKCPIKTLDALHIASAMEARTELFVSGDRRQISAAKVMRVKSKWV